MSLPADVARCPGFEADGEWREGCEDCQRRTEPPADPERVWRMAAPTLVVFECEARIPPAYEIPAHNLAATRPAPISFEAARAQALCGVRIHGANCALQDEAGPSRESHQPNGGAVCADAQTPKSEAREQQQLRAGLCHHEERAS